MIVSENLGMVKRGEPKKRRGEENVGPDRGEGRRGLGRKR